MENIKSKKIKRSREPSFTKIRNPYKKYQCADWNWTDILNEIKELKDLKVSKFIKKISDKYGIKYKTLLNKYNMHENNKIMNINEENRGGTNKTFNEKEEKRNIFFLKRKFYQ